MTRSLLAVLLVLVVLVVPVIGRGEEKPVRVLIETDKGDIEVELDAAKAPNTVANFLKYVDGKFYDGGKFHRTVTPDNQPDNKVKIEVIQAGINPEKTKDEFQPIKLERTKDTGLKHKDGTISMARDGPDTATSRLLHLHRRPARTRLRRQAQPGRPGLRRVRQGREGDGRGEEDSVGAREGADAEPAVTIKKVTRVP